MDTYVLMYTTWPDADQARSCVQILLDQKLIACANILPRGESLYRWNGEVTRDEEIIMLLKTRKARSADIRDAVLACHPYDTPCVLTLAIDAGSSAPDFLTWIAQETC